MEEIEVGEFVRTKEEEIHKVIYIINYDHEKPDYEFYKYYKFENDMGDFQKNIIKHSKNIADVLKIGDIAIMICYGQKVQKFLDRNDIIEIKIGNYKLLKVMCKEMFDKKSYEVE